MVGGRAGGPAFACWLASLAPGASGGCAAQPDPTPSRQRTIAPRAAVRGTVQRVHLRRQPFAGPDLVADPACPGTDPLRVAEVAAVAVARHPAGDEAQPAPGVVTQPTAEIG